MVIFHSDVAVYQSVRLSLNEDMRRHVYFVWYLEWCWWKKTTVELTVKHGSFWWVLISILAYHPQMLVHGVSRNMLVHEWCKPKICQSPQGQNIAKNVWNAVLSFWAGYYDWLFISIVFWWFHFDAMKRADVLQWLFFFSEVALAPVNILISDGADGYWSQVRTNQLGTAHLGWSILILDHLVTWWQKLWWPNQSRIDLFFFSCKTWKHLTPFVDATKKHLADSVLPKLNHWTDFQSRKIESWNWILLSMMQMALHVDLGWSWSSIILPNFATAPGKE